MKIRSNSTPKISTIFSPRAYRYKVKHLILAYLKRFHADYRGIVFADPGHFYSPLIKISGLPIGGATLPFDGDSYWENIDLRQEEQRALFAHLASLYRHIEFPEIASDSRRYYSKNEYFSTSDAFLLAALIEHVRPGRIVEIGSGFSSGVMIDTIDRLGLKTCLKFVEPFPERLYQVLKNENCGSEVIADIVQNVDLAVFDDLESGDILFVDSSHVAKVGSDVSHIFLRILPRLRSGVYVHIHDVVYPESYPTEWIMEGRAWNESLFLRSFLLFNEAFEVVAFNNYAWKIFPEVFSECGIDCSRNPGGSFWMKRA